MTDRVAVIGSGVSGLTAAHLLSKTSDVTLFEAEPRLGGHAHTHTVIDSAGTTHRVDTGFLVHNDRTYPTLLGLFAELGIATQSAEMSMSVHCRGCGLRYAGAKGVRGLLPSARVLTQPRYLRMLADVPRWHRAAGALLASPDGNPTVGEFTAAHGFNRYFIDHFLAPLVATVWSCPGADALDYPARHLFAFLANHGMLSVTGSPQWRTVVGGSATYVDAIARRLSAVHVNVAVRALSRTSDGVEIRDAADRVHTFDRAVIATHADDALHLLVDADPHEKQVLGAFTYSANTTVLHTDTSLLPPAGPLAASWNTTLPHCRMGSEPVAVSYDVSRLMNLSGAERYVVTLNDTTRVDPATILATMSYRHPIFSPEAVAAQPQLAALSGPRLAFAGAHHGWGFHEDGALSGAAAARALGVG